MPHPSTLVLCALLVTKTVCFAFVGVAPSVGLGGKILTLPRSASGAAPISQTAERRVRRTTHELQQQQQHQYRDLGGRHGSRGDMRRGRGILATADDDEDGEEVLPARTPVVTNIKGPERICVLGGGFGGLYAALRLQKMPWRGQKPIVTLVDKRDKFTFLPLLYEFAIGNAELDEVAPTFRELLAGSGVSFVQGCVSDVDLGEKEVTMVGATSDDLDGFMISDDADQARTIKYDKLVLAVGAEPASSIDKVPGARERAIPFYSIEDSFRVKQAITKLKVLVRETAVARVVVVGGSYAGVELSCNLATELGGRRGPGKVEVTLATGSEVLSAATPGNREAGLRRLEESGVRVMTGTRVAEVRENGVVVLQPKQEAEVAGSSADDGEEIMADLLVWTAGSQPSSLVESLDVPKDLRGRIEVDRRLRLVSAAVGEGDGRAGGVGAAGDVYCLGDIAAVEGLDLGCNAQVALQQSDYVAYNIWADKERRRPLDFRFLNLGEMMNLGGLDGSVTTLGGRVKLTGKAAGLARRAVYAIRMPTNPQRVRAAASAAAGTAFSVTNALLEKGLDVLERASEKE
ncbi:unnamed protein product [Pylaiella littoralis]